MGGLLHLRVPAHLQGSTDARVREHLSDRGLQGSFVTILPLAPSWRWGQGTQSRFCFAQLLLIVLNLTLSQCLRTHQLHPLR